MADTTKKYKIHRVIDAQGNLEVVHPETDAGQVLYENTIGSNTVKNVNEALAALKALAESSGVTGVKGAAENSYRKGNVNITPAHIGAVASNAEITGGTFTKVTVDKKGLVTGGSNATLDDIADGTTRKLANYILKSQMGVASGVATLGTDGKIPTAQLPSYVDDVVEGYLYQSKFYEDVNHTTEITASAGKIYVDITLGAMKTYRWSGMSYVEISASLALGETSATAYAGDKGAENRSRIEDLEADVAGIKLGGITVEKAADANKLGGKAASLYALKEELPAEELYVVNGTLELTTVTLTGATFTSIKTAIADGKIPVIKLQENNSVTRCYYYSQNSNDTTLLFVNTQGTIVRTLTITSSSKTVTTVTLADSVNDTGTGAIVSSIAKSGSAINITRRALQNSDLPTQSGLAAGVYSAVNVTTKGVVTAGGTAIEWGTSGQTEPSDSLMVGGLFFELVE